MRSQLANNHSKQLGELNTQPFDRTPAVLAGGGCATVRCNATGSPVSIAVIWPAGSKINPRNRLATTSQTNARSRSGRCWSVHGAGDSARSGHD